MRVGHKDQKWGFHTCEALRNWSPSLCGQAWLDSWKFCFLAVSEASPLHADIIFKEPFAQESLDLLKGSQWEYTWKEKSNTEEFAYLESFPQKAEPWSLWMKSFYVCCTMWRIQKGGEKGVQGIRRLSRWGRRVCQECGGLWDVCGVTSPCRFPGSCFAWDKHATLFSMPRAATVWCSAASSSLEDRAWWGGAGQPSGQRWGGADSSRLVFLRDSAPHSEGLLSHPFSLPWGPVGTKGRSGDLTLVVCSLWPHPMLVFFPLWRGWVRKPWGGRRLWSLSSVHLLSRVQLFETPWTAAGPASLSITNSRSLLKLRARNWSQ